MRQIQVLVTCDRCSRPFVNKVVDGEAIPSLPQTGYKVTKTCDGAETQIVEYAEVCPDCSGTIENYVAKLSLKRTEKGAEKPQVEKLAEVKIQPVAGVEATPAAPPAPGNGGTELTS